MDHSQEWWDRKRRDGYGTDQKRCNTCKELKARTGFTRDKGQFDGYYPMCNDCKREYQRNLYKINPQVFKDSVKRWDAKNADKKEAHWKLNEAVKAGIIEKPKTCQICGASGRIEGHHWRGYAKEFQLDVQWLCCPCHRKENTKDASRVIIE